MEAFCLVFAFPFTNC